MRFASVCLIAAACSSPAPSSPDAAPVPVAIGLGTPICQGPSTPSAEVNPNFPNELGDPAIARITPPTYPFVVEAIAYQLRGGKTWCGTNIAHAVTVYAAPGGGSPPATPPVDAQRITVAATASSIDALVVTEPLTAPITLTTGQDLFIALEMDANADKSQSVCIDSCPITADDQRSFWSEQTSPPFTYATLTADGIKADYAIWATGH